MHIWETTLGKFIVEGGESDNLIKFYTSLYHSFMAPTIFSENGYYFGFDKKVHPLLNGMKNYYTDMSIWDVHRTEFPWLVLTQPEVMNDIINSMLLMYRDGGDLPKWPLANGETNCMIGTHVIVTIVDAYLKGIRNFDVNLAYKAMVDTATTSRRNGGRTDIDDWIKIGYIPYEKSRTGACETQSYAFDDWALANLATVLGNKNDSNLFYSRSKNYKNVWNSDYKFFCPKTSSGTWECPPTWLNVFDDRYVEGDAWHYRWFASGDVKGLVDLFGSNTNFVDELEYFMYRSQFDPFNVLPNPYYWAGNEPDILAPWMFNFANRPDLTQKYVRWNLDNRFTTEPDGIPGNDDYGTMSAWFLFGSLGFYPLAGSTTFALGSPLFPKVTIIRTNGNLTITAHNWSKEKFYVDKVLVNGVQVTSSFIDWDQIKGQSSIEFWLK